MDDVAELKSDSSKKGTCWEITWLERHLASWWSRLGGCCEGTKSAKGRQSKKEHCESAHVRKMTLVNKQHSSRQTKSRKSKESKSMTAETYTAPKQQLGNVRNSVRRTTQHNLQPNTRRTQTPQAEGNTTCTHSTRSKQHHQTKDRMSKPAGDHLKSLVGHSGLCMAM